ncbi:MAG: tagaturonate reductase [Oscillospiraceae bacterium]|nr:tagaturonate reductase [Oscillospiraceae bacterium]MCI1990992.1 tagaturonate reductase [Oscillospiraceae bacterium]MCI2035429.1 tagaturonate reductase [Oscillospiraceae bacterium]
MKKINELYSRTPRPIRIVQFGEGNFLRGFVDYMVDVANGKGVFDGDVAIVKPIPFGSLDRFHAQDNIYTISLRGKMNGKTYVENRVVTCVQKALDAYGDYKEFMALAHLDSLQFVVSNTTEAGIAYDPEDRFELTPPNSYPGKLTKFLYERFQAFHGDPEKGLVMLPVELIEDNGKNLKKCVLKLTDRWKLGDGFRKWVEESNIFCSTLVDRIITGYPRDEAPKMWESLGYEDDLLDTGEPFSLWVIESDRDISKKFPLDKAGLHIVFTKNQRPYRERKVRILNGAHTSTVLAGYLMGRNIVLECMNDPVIRKLMETIVFREIVPTVKLPREEAVGFANSVFERFENPFVKHALLSISLNSVSKWKARILPTFRDNYAATKTPPKYLTFSFAALMAFYTSDILENGVLIGNRGGEAYEIRDDRKVLEFFAANSKGKSTRAFVTAFASNTGFWGEDLTKYSGFVDLVTKDLEDIRKNGMQATVEALVKE